MNRIAIFREMPIFGGIQDHILEFLVGMSEQCRFETGEYLFREKDPADTMMVLLEGKVSVVKHWKGRELLLGTLGKGDCVGEMSLLDMSPRSASVVACTPCVAIYLTSTALNELHNRDLAQFTTIQLNIAREVCRRLRETDQQLCELRIRNTERSLHN